MKNWLQMVPVLWRTKTIKIIRQPSFPKGIHQPIEKLEERVFEIN